MRWGRDEMGSGLDLELMWSALAQTQTLGELRQAAIPGTILSTPTFRSCDCLGNGPGTHATRMFRDSNHRREFDALPQRTQHQQTGHSPNILRVESLT
jgi:hypothetical protein